MQKSSLNPLEFTFHGIYSRWALSSDCEALLLLINDAYSYQNEVKGEPRISMDKLRLQMQEVNFYVLIKYDEIIGCVYLKPIKRTLHFGLLALNQTNRKRGIASALIKSIESYASANRFKNIELDYMSLAPWLKRYYETHGFSETGDTTTWGPITLIKMRKILD